MVGYKSGRLRDEWVKVSSSHAGGGHDASNSRARGRARPGSSMPLAVVVCVLAIAACGSSAKPNTSSHAASSVAFSECMRSHGVPNFPDPAGGNLNLNGTGINPSSPAFEAAQATCNKLQPSSGPSTPPASQRQKEQLLEISECMRSHHVTGFPDPTTKPPSSPQGYSIEQGVASNLFLLVPNTININSPAFQQAAKACHLSLTSSFAG
jgi:hypothetical protein